MMHQLAERASRELMPTNERVLDLRRLVRPLHVATEGMVILVAPGVASGPGWYYENDATARIELPPVAATTGVRVVLRVNFEAQEVRAIALMARTGDAIPPSGERIVGTVIDHPLASGLAHAGGFLFLVQDPDAERVIV
jgi:hypothetical protein